MKPTNSLQAGALCILIFYSFLSSHCFVVSLGSQLPAISSEIFSWLDTESTSCHAADRAADREISCSWCLRSHFAQPMEKECFSLLISLMSRGNWQLQTVSDVNWIFWNTLINSLPGNAKDTETADLQHDGLFSRPAVGGPPPCKTPREGKENSDWAKNLTLYRGLV